MYRPITEAACSMNKRQVWLGRYVAVPACLVIAIGLLTHTDEIKWAGWGIFAVFIVAALVLRVRDRSW
jgi:hypothetical protein